MPPSHPDRFQWPDTFQWGVSTSAYQIEGAVTEGGRGPSIWDTFSHEPGRIADGSTGDVACDHYRRLPEDLDLIADLGVGTYRFSVAWPRIQPTGAGPANAAGLDWYDRLVDGLLERGIDPMATLFHWDLPQALQDEGGWFNRDTAARLGEYAELVAQRLGDRVKLWLTLNEPFVFTSLGHLLGTHAPGRQRFDELFPVIHHQLLGHGLATAAIRRHSGSPVGLANSYSPVRAVGPDGLTGSAGEADQAVAPLLDAFMNWLFTDPILFGRYPDGVELLATVDPASIVLDGDLALISAPVDALGVNYYNPTAVSAPPADGQPPDGPPLPFVIGALNGYDRTGSDWPIVPDGLRELLVSLHDRYQKALPPIWITENGCAYPAGTEDQNRIDYLDAHLAALGEAMSSGVDVHGYCVWSLLDNFEWGEGYSQRFGLVEVDFATQHRTPRASYRWYRDHIRASRNGS